MRDPHALQLDSVSTFSVIAGKLLPADHPEDDVEELCSDRYEIVTANRYIARPPAPPTSRPTVIALAPHLVRTRRPQ